MKKMKKILTILIFIISLGFCSNNCFGIGLSPVGIDVINNPYDIPSDLTSNKTSTAEEVVGDKVSKVAKIILGFSATIGLLVFVYAGVKMLLSRGDAGAFKKSLDLVLYTFIGIIIILFSYVIVKFLVEFLPSVLSK